MQESASRSTDPDAGIIGRRVSVPPLECECRADGDDLTELISFQAVGNPKGLVTVSTSNEKRFATDEHDGHGLLKPFTHIGSL